MFACAHGPFVYLVGHPFAKEKKWVRGPSGPQRGRNIDQYTVLPKCHRSVILSFMAIEVRRKEGESGNSVLYSFTRKVKRSGIIKEIRKRKYHTRTISRVKRRSSAIHREEKKADIERQKKLGLI
jgi:ribosomal protein S21